MKHNHHLVPQHRGGTDADGLVEVSVIQHAMFHYCEWRLHGHWQDKTAWRMLVGLQQGSREGVPHTEEAKQKMSDSQRKSFQTPERQENHRHACIARYKTEEGKAHLKENGRKTKSMWKPEWEESRLKALREKLEITYTIKKDEMVEYLTAKQFISKYGGNLSSLKQMIWRKGAYKGWQFSQGVV